MITRFLLSQMHLLNSSTYSCYIRNIQWYTHTNLLFDYVIVMVMMELNYSFPLICLGGFIWSRSTVWTCANANVVFGSVVCIYVQSNMHPCTHPGFYACIHAGVKCLFEEMNIAGKNVIVCVNIYALTIAFVIYTAIACHIACLVLMLLMVYRSISKRAATII